MFNLDERKESDENISSMNDHTADQELLFETEKKSEKVTGEAKPF